ncbi:acyl carrier protein [Pedobacter sp. AK017]|uniref:acyl carrier protein n=1 Tax=Pedobacter sp. AK017 TaxID=2723073 RepID=UPI00160D7C76|nr:phosphopantetheine-binding protein [Pedobacter sp. AK017]MBB5441241.1 acyl carrier protein [Pedobacter sp. AK017]
MIETIKKVIAKVTDDPEMASNLNEDADIINDVGLDSLQMIDFMLQIEDELDIELDFDTIDISHFSSLKSFAGFLATQRNNQ